MKSIISNLFGSIMVRLALIFGALATMTAAAIIIGWMVFQSIATNMAIMTEERIPDLKDSAAVVSVADRVRGLLSDILIAATPEKLEKLDFKKALVLQDLRDGAAAFSGGKTVELSTMIDDVETALNELSAARNSEFLNTAGVALSVEQALDLATKASGVLEELSDNAYFELVIGGEDTIEAIDTTLSNLVERDFTIYQSALEVRSEVNLLSGLALSISQTRDQATASILVDLGRASDQRLIGLLGLLAGSPSNEDLISTIDGARSEIVEAFQGPRSAITPARILSLRQTVDATLAPRLDDLYFDLVINSDAAKTGNEDAIRNLMDIQVNRIREQANLNATTQSFFATIMQTALARDAAELGLMEDALSVSALQLTKAMENSPPEIKDKLSIILEFSDPQGGIIAARAKAINAGSEAANATEKAAASVRKIATEIVEFARNAQTQIEVSSEDLNREVEAAQDQFKTIAITSLIIVLIAPFLIWSMVTKPLNKITATTERLANGDLSEINGLDRNRGEIGRLAKALKIFREGALERIKLQEEEKHREAEVRKAEREAEGIKRASEERERKSEEERQQRQRDREAEDARRKEDVRRQAEAEQKVLAKEQELVVSELAGGLRRLSRGDLTHTIEVDFPETYQELRNDYNSALQNLGKLVLTLSNSASAIDESSIEIASSSLDLSRRTENSAATLEETAAALNELTASVSSAARGAAEANNTVDTVKHDAENSQSIMENAVSAMEKIEGSSTEIAKIVEVIDSIAFQTNLLALNAGVEAARAGDAGRGFAVVASEVRSLAHRCSDAAEQINKLIRDSTSHVEEGVSMIGETNKALQGILSGIRDVSKNVSAIAVSSEEQSCGIAEINTAVEQLDRSTQKNAAMFEETTAASQSLTAEASELAKAISKFQVPSSLKKECYTSPSKVA